MEHIATEPIYSPDADGVQRLVAAKGDPIPETVAAPTPVVTGPPPTPIVSELAIADYASLTEAEVVERLGDLSPDELVAVRTYEQANAARGSITRYGLDTRPVAVSRRDVEPTPVGAVAPEPVQPAAGPPEGGWDSLGVEELEAEADRRSLTVEGSGKNGNVTKKDLVAALEGQGAGA